MRQLHIWLSLALVVASALHLLLHWQTLIGHFKRQALWVAFVSTAAVSLAFVTSAVIGTGDGHGPNGMRAVFRAIETSPIENLAVLLDSRPEELIDRLEAAGMTVPGESSSLHEVAETSRRDVREVMAVALSLPE